MPAFRIGLVTIELIQFQRLTLLRGRTVLHVKSRFEELTEKRPAIVATKGITREELPKVDTFFCLTLTLVSR